MPTTDTVVGRLQLTHPDLNHDGGSALHTKVRNAWTKLGDNTADRFFTVDALADAGTQAFAHNYKCSIDEIGSLLYLRNTGTGELTRINAVSSPPITDFDIVATSGSETTSIDVTNNSGGPQDLALITSQNGGGSGGGAGGSSVDWHAPAGLAPLAQEEFGQPVYLYSNGNDNQLNSSIKIPDGYQPGSQIFLKVVYYTSGVSSSLKLQTVASLIRNGTDAINSVVNQHSSTNAANAGDALAYKYFEVDLDLTDVAGMINSVIVNPGDVLNVELTRGSDVEAADIRVVPAATELKF